MKKKLVVIAGPTGSGKTALAIRLAQQLGIEIVSADSRQIFREMSIGTAQPSDNELRTATHHLIGHLSVTEDYNAAKFAFEAESIINKLFEKYPIVLLCGGSGLYIDALLKGLDSIPEIPDEIRKGLLEEYEIKGLEWLQKEAQAWDPVWFEEADQENPRRLLRCLEVFRATGKKLSDFQKKKTAKHEWEVLKIGLDLPRAILYQRIDQRVLEMVNAGLFEEVEALKEYRNLKALQTVGYREIFDWMDGRVTKEKCIELIQQHSRNYAKRQLTWFRKDTEMKWINPGDSSAFEKILKWIQEGTDQ